METLLHTLFTLVVSEHCANTLITERDFLNVGCIKLTVSRALSYAVILGAIVGEKTGVKDAEGKECGEVLAWWKRCPWKEELSWKWMQPIV